MHRYRPNFQRLSPNSPRLIFCNYSLSLFRLNSYSSRLTHGPAHLIFDRTNAGDFPGCETLRDYLSKLRPRLHVAGHIHEAHGAYLHKWYPADGFAPPTIQNDDPVALTSSSTANVSELTSSEDDGDVELERTVFVNAANWPMGALARRDGVKPMFGGPGFQAVVVDLKE